MRLHGKRTFQAEAAGGTKDLETGSIPGVCVVGLTAAGWPEWLEWNKW